MRNLHRGYQPLIAVIAAAELKRGQVMSQPLASFQIGSNIQDRLNTAFHSVPKILVFLFILIIGWFVATAAIVIVALGVIAVFNQVGLATAVTRPILYTVLLTCGAIIAIGVGGGLIKPMQARWERMLAAAERETSSQFAAYQQGRTATEGQARRQVQQQEQQQAQQQAQQQEQQQAQQQAGHEDERQDQPPTVCPQPACQPPGPRYLQSHGFARGAGYLRSPVFSPGPGYHQSLGHQQNPDQLQETGIQDDPDNYPGGQYM